MGWTCNISLNFLYSPMRYVTLPKSALTAMWTDKQRRQATAAKRHKAAPLSDAIRDYKAEHPKASLREVAKVFNVSHMTIKRAQRMRKFEAGKKGNVESVKVRSKGKAELTDRIRAIMADDPSLSSRQIAKIVNRSQSTVSRAMRGIDT